jgi:Na+/melibiose symporter-like transporter
MTLFDSASFTCGVILAALPLLAMISILFTLPQYFQGVVGTSAMGSGLRLLPLIAGLMLGAVPAARVVQLVGAKVVVAVGFFLLAIGLLIGATTGLGSSGVFTAAWMAVAGVGVGMAMATATSAALVELSQESSGVGGAVLQAVSKIGGPMGTAILGSVLSVGYLAGLHWRDCRQPRRPPSVRASSAGWRSPTSWARRPCSTRCGRPLSMAWTGRSSWQPPSPWAGS